MKARGNIGTASRRLAAAFVLAAALPGCKNPILDMAKTLRAEAGSPNVSITKGAASLETGGTIDFGKVSTNGYKDIALTVGNVAGKSELSLDLAKVEIAWAEGTESSTFSLVTASLDPIGPDGVASLVIRFNPSSTGLKSATISIPTNDVKHARFSLTLAGASVANEKELSSFAFANPAAGGLISGADVAVAVPYGTDLRALVAIFETTGVSVYVGSNLQVSGTTANDFSSPVVYSVRAADGTAKSFTVAVTAAKNDAKAITAFAFPAYGVTAAIAGLGISATLPYGAPLSALAPTFSTTGASVSVAGVPQVSGVSANDFSSPLPYLVTADDGSTREYLVTVSAALNPAKDITAFSIAVPSSSSVAGVITGTNIAVTVPYGSSLSSLVASFETTGASVRIGGATQTSGATANDFSKALAYTVVAADGSAKTYTVQVSAAPSSSKDITSFTAISPASAVGIIDGTTITLSIPYSNAYGTFPITATYITTGTSVTTLGSIQYGSTIVSSSGQTYTVTDGENKTKVYTVVASSRNVVPSLTTGSVGSIGTTTASAGGSIIHSGGASLEILDSGICWGTSPTPTILDGCVRNGGAGAGASSISALAMTGLTPGTKYFVRAWAQNSVTQDNGGYGYGSPSSFWTLLETPPAPTLAAVGGSAGSGKLNVSWTAMPGATAYDVYCGATGTRPASPTLSTSDSSCQLSGLADFSTYHVWLVSRSASPVPSPTSAASTGYPGVHVDRISMPSELTLWNGISDQLSAAVSPIEATYQTLAWTSSDESIATVSASGLVTAGNVAGNATITARAKAPDASVYASCAVAVRTHVNGISLDRSSAALVSGATLQLAATVTPADAYNKTVTWSSSNTSVATVSASGLVTVTGPGTATITALTEDQAKSATCAISYIVPTGLNFADGALALEAGSSRQLQAIISPSDATNPSLTWSTSNAAVATVDASGSVTAVGAGQATITATTVDGGKTAPCSVMVSQKFIYSSVGVYSLSVPAASIVTVKAWGAGGGGGKESNSGGGGGAGGYAYSVFSAQAGQSLAIAVGAGGWNTAPSGAPALSGALGGTQNGPGGGASVVALWNGSLYTLETCAAGGGGASRHNSGYAGAGGQAGEPCSGADGAGGRAYWNNPSYIGNPGMAMSLTSATFAGLGGNGGNAQGAGCGAGGGGYGGGGAPGTTSLYYTGFGGGNYGNGGSVTGGSGATIANTADADYVTGVGRAGTFASPNGGNGRVVVTITPKTQFTSPGVYTIPLSASATVTVKAWGAGGGGGKESNSGGSAGAGAYACSVFSASAGQSLAIAVGAGGWNAAPSGAPAPGGITGGYGGPGGGASSVALYDGSLYTLKACAAGGGGASGHNSANAGGGGQNGAWGGPAGANGLGGAGGGGNSGQNMSLTASTFAGLGGAGGACKGGMTGAGGGGYGGGASNGTIWLYYDGAGGGNYCSGTGATTIAADRTAVANSSDVDYAGGVGSAGAYASQTGGNGRVVVTLSY